MAATLSSLTSSFETTIEEKMARSMRALDIPVTLERYTINLYGAARPTSSPTLNIIFSPAGPKRGDLITKRTADNAIVINPSEFYVAIAEQIGHLAELSTPADYKAAIATVKSECDVITKRTIQNMITDRYSLTISLTPSSPATLEEIKSLAQAQGYEINLDIAVFEKGDVTSQKNERSALHPERYADDGDYYQHLNTQRGIIESRQGISELKIYQARNNAFIKAAEFCKTEGFKQTDPTALQAILRIHERSDMKINHAGISL